METVRRLTEPAIYDGTGGRLEGDVFPGHDLELMADDDYGFPFAQSFSTRFADLNRKRYFVLRVASCLWYVP